MSERLRSFVAPAYLFLCLLLGGSAQGVWGNAVLRILAILIIAWAFISRRDEGTPRALRHLLVLAALALLVGILQLIPLPASLWTTLPGREPIADGLSLLGLQPGAMPVSLAPYETLAVLLALLPPLGMLAAMIAFRGQSRALLALALIAGTMGGVLLGVLQVSSPDAEASPWYLYRHSNFGVATGFFANSNHMASLLLVAIPFIAALGAQAREGAKDVKHRSAILALAGGGLVVVILGLALNGSLAGYGLGVPVVLASLLMLLAPSRRVARGGMIAIALAGLVALGLIWNNPVSDRIGAGNASVTTRQTILANSAHLIGQYFPVGSGIGTFESVYAMGEDPAKVDRYRINHAHNDYAELAVETGLAGIILMLLFLAWWVHAVWRMLRSPTSDQYALAGAIASAAILLHSAVDFPLRTAAIGALLAMCLVLIVQSRRTAKSEGDLRPVRHLSVG